MPDRTSFPSRNFSAQMSASHITLAFFHRSRDFTMNTEIRFRSMTKAASSMSLAAAAILAFSGGVEAQMKSSAPADLLQELSVKAAMEASKTGEQQTIDDQHADLRNAGAKLQGTRSWRVAQAELSSVWVFGMCRSMPPETCAAIDRVRRADLALVISAHLDTVFPEAYRRQGEARGRDTSWPRHR